MYQKIRYWEIQKFTVYPNSSNNLTSTDKALHFYRQKLNRINRKLKKFTLYRPNDKVEKRGVKIDKKL